MVNTVRANAEHDFNPFADHMTKLQNFTKDENRDFFIILIFTSLNA